MKRHKYMTPEAIRFVKSTKINVANIMRDMGISAADLHRRTGIPESTLSRWLDTETDEFMGFAKAAIVADAMGVTVRELLAFPAVRSIDDERYRAIEPLLSAPLDHVVALCDMYKAVRRQS